MRPNVARPCSSPGCPNLRPCAQHARPAWGGTSQRERTGRPGLSQATRMRILRRDCYTCECGARSSRQVDHIVPRSEGGTDEDDNLVTRCDACHARKSAEEGARASARVRAAAAR